MFGHNLHHLSAVIAGAAALAGCSAGDLSLPSDSNPFRMEAVSGDGQEATAGSLLPRPLVVQLTDAAERPVPGASLVFSFQGDVPEAEIDPGLVQTDSSGRASVRARLGSTIGTQIIEARLDSAAGRDLRAIFGMTAIEARKNAGGGGGGEAGNGGGSGGGRQSADNGGGGGGGGKDKGKHKGKGGHGHQDGD
jgi:uncharacterized membrane protein YgcG